jgi:hypothetical protein
VLRRERLDVSSAVPVRFSKRVLRALGREQDARLGNRDPSPSSGGNANKEWASVASVVPSSFIASDGVAASPPNSHLMRLIIPILEVSCCPGAASGSNCEAELDASTMALGGLGHHAPVSVERRGNC